MRQLKDRTVRLVAASVLVACCLIVRIIDPSPVLQMRLLTFDFYQRISPRIADPQFPVRIVAIDDVSLAEVGQWPWPRTKLAEIVNRLKTAGARTITFDVMFSEPDRLSPQELLRAIGADNASSALLAEVSKLPSNDDVLADSISGSKPPVVIGLIGLDHGSQAVLPSRAHLAFAGDDPRQFLRTIAGGLSNVPVIERRASGVGVTNWFPSQDQVVRKIPLLLSIHGEIYPSLAAETLRLGSGQSTIFVKSSNASGANAFGQSTGIEVVRIGDMVLPVDAQGEFWIYYASSDAHRIISARSVLDGDIDPAEIHDRHIMIGATAAGLSDIRASPLDPVISGVEIHAQALEQMLSGQHLQRPAFALGAELLFLCVVCAATVWLLVNASAIHAAALSIVAIVSVVLMSWFAFAYAGLLFDPVYPALCLGLVYSVSALTSYVQSEVARSRIRAAFGHYVAPALVAELAEKSDKLRLGGETREITLLFADVRAFSQIAEDLDAEKLVSFVNHLFTPLTNTVLKHHGTVDKFMGDSVMAFWNAPVDDRQHAQHACQAALAMLDEIDHLNHEFMAQGAQSWTAVGVRMGFGLNTGDCVVGNFGSPQRFDYSVIGDAVNVAARLEEATKIYGCEIIVGERTAALAPTFALLPIGAITPRGRTQQEQIYGLVGNDDLASTAAFRRLQAAHTYLLTARAAGNPVFIAQAIAECRECVVGRAGSLYRSGSFLAGVPESR